MTLVADELNTGAAEEAVAQRRTVAALAQAGRFAEVHARKLDPFHEGTREPDAPRTNVSWERYARRVLWAIASDDENGISYERADRYFRFLARCMTAQTVFPFLTPDLEGGLVIEWSSGRTLIEIDLESDGEYFFLHTDGSPQPLIKDSGRVSGFNISHLRGLLSVFSQEVSLRNPEWRQFYV